MSKSLITTIVVLIIIVLGGIWLMSKNTSTTGLDTENASSTEENLTKGVPADGTYDLSTADSKVEWIGTKTLITDYKDVGTIDLQSGSFAVVNGQVASGTIVFNMKTITGTETSNKEAPVSSLSKHLQSADFFDVAKYPTATFSVTGAEAVGGTDGAFMLTGSLDLKGIKNEIQFPVEFSKLADGRTMVAGSFKIDRTKWGLKYGSGQFFKDLGDKVIGDEVDVRFEAVAEMK